MSKGRFKNSGKQDWCTPKKYVDAVKEFYGGEIDLDPCSNPESIVDANIQWSLPETDGLKKDWNYKRIFVNPPYGTDRQRKTSIKDWLRKCSEAFKSHNSEVIALVPVSTNTSHWIDYVFDCATAVCFLYDTRLRFRINGNEDNKGAPMACCLVYYGCGVEKFKKSFASYGYTVKTKE